MRYSVAIFDFDGTVSLLREGWSGIMADVGLGHLGAPGDAVRDEFERAMLALSGRPSIVQMEKLASLIVARGGPAVPAESLHADFEARLFDRIAARKRSLAAGDVPPAAWAVPGTHELLAALTARGLVLYLVSGTDKPDVLAEAALLQLLPFFEPTVYAPTDRSGRFHKRDAIAEIVDRHRLTGSQVIGFGDGFSETAEVVRIGGTAVGVASVEVGQVGPNRSKAELLASLGADPIVPDFRDLALLVSLAAGSS
jgi:phosphoglycolate phosphatase-like HAD superfamily hydrolase